MNTGQRRSTGSGELTTDCLTGTDHCHNVRKTSGRCCWKDGRGSMSRMRFTGDADGFCSSIHEISTSAAVHVNIHKPGRDIAAFCIDNPDGPVTLLFLSNGNNSGADKFDHAVCQQTIR